MRLPGPMTDRDMALAEWSVDVATNHAGDLFISAWEEIMVEVHDLPYWAWVRRYRLKAEADACARLFHIFTTQP